MDELLKRRSIAEVLTEGLTFVVQPILKLDSLDCVGYEMLARVEYDGRVFLPGEFLPYLGDEDAQVFESILHKHMLRLFSSLPEHLFLSVNVPSYEALSAYKKHNDLICYADRIHLELLESVDWSVEHTRSLLGELAKLGYSLYLDDFGVGYANIKMLLGEAFDGIKLDSTVLKRAVELNSHAELMQVLEMLFRMKYKVVVEGVETPEDFVFLNAVSREVMCQGFLFGLPGHHLYG